MSAVAFFPWLTLNEPLQIGPLRFIPWRQGAQPGDSANALQKDLDAVLSAYANRARVPVKRAVLLEVGAWRIGHPLTEEVRTELFRVRELIGFAALSRRALFSNFDYTNFDAYQLVVQAYESGRADRFSYTTRRRDGGTLNYWGASDFAFQRPRHVDAHAHVDVDVPLLSVLTGSIEQNMADAIAEFNRANTDSDEVQPHLEMVRLKSAFEYLLDIGSDYRELQDALSKLLPSRDKVDGPLGKHWEQRYPKTEGLLSQWAQDFSFVRGRSAHGVKRSAGAPVWDERRHLVFGSVLFPLVLKQALAKTRQLDLDTYDAIRLARLEAYLVQDPFEVIVDSEGEEQFPWQQVETDARMRVVAVRIEQELRAAADRTGDDP